MVAVSCGSRSSKPTLRIYLLSKSNQISELKDQDLVSSIRITSLKIFTIEEDVLGILVYDESSALIRIFSYDFKEHKFIDSQKEKLELDSFYKEEPRVLKAELFDSDGAFFLAYIANNNVDSHTIGSNSLKFDSLQVDPQTKQILRQNIKESVSLFNTEVEDISCFGNSCAFLTNTVNIKVIKITPEKLVEDEENEDKKKY